ncbi:MAG: DNA photolyase family protein [Phycisphaerales bacterium]|nr:DNA photolyase family protein [Phycisphaerales bacterium]
MRTLIWLRNDLRVLDNPALAAALARGRDGCIALFLICPDQWRRHGWGNPRVSFTMDCLRALRPELDRLGIPLLIRTITQTDDITETIADVVQAHHCDEVHVNLEHGLDEQARDQTVADHLHDQGMTLVTHHGDTILPIDAVRTAEGRPYSVFTPYRRRWEGHLQEDGLPVPHSLIALSEPVTRSEEIPHSIQGYSEWPGQELWPAGTDEALRRLDRFLDGFVKRYHIDRDWPSLDGTSSLSPYLAVGAISPVTAVRRLLDTYGDDLPNWPQGPACWLSELAWREFYRQVMHFFPVVSMNKPMQSWTKDIPWSSDESHFNAWATGQTGIDIVDAGMNQLTKTGWMHNRVRMIVAMFLTKNLMIDWRRGEAFFANHLVDYDFPSNNGGWQWAASTGTDAAPYFRIFNPDRQAETWDPRGEYLRTWLDRSPGSLEPIVSLSESRRNAIAAFKAVKASHSQGLESVS